MSVIVFVLNLMLCAIIKKTKRVYTSTHSILAAQMIALTDEGLAAKLEAKKIADAKAVLAKDAAVAAEFNK